jgi:UDP-hydrolysing UDP-N-acetyl-D-glucosamine 2-epimerase
MKSTLAAISAHPKLKLQIVATGMHLDKVHGRSVERIEKIDAIVPWGKGSRSEATGLAISGLAKAFKKLKPDIVLVVGDRVEAFAAATAAHLAGIAVAHVHGGDRAQGQVDDALRHAITKLSHIHFPATRKSALRIKQLGEDAWRIHCVGSPGIDGIREAAGPLMAGLRRRKFALLVLHPLDAGESVEYQRAKLVLGATLAANVRQIVIIYPNNDPGSRGIIRSWNEMEGDKRLLIHMDVDRATFLGLLRDAAVLVGNSSSGIIEAGSFGTPVVDIGARQMGREKSPGVINVPYQQGRIRAAITAAIQRPRTVNNLYGGGPTARQIADILGNIKTDDRLLRKIIGY